MSMKTKISFIILILSTFASCDEICENEEGDLIWINNPEVNYSVDIDDPSISSVGRWNEHLEVDDHEYTYQISVPYENGDPKIILFYKKSFKNGDQIDWNTALSSDLIGKYGFKDLDFKRILGYQERAKPPPESQCLQPVSRPQHFLL